MQRRALIRLAGSAVCALPWVAALSKPALPSGPISLVVPFPPGGASDVFARVIGRKLADSLGQPFIVDNRAGATGLIGTGLVKRAKPDGATLLVASNSSQIIAPLMKATPPYDGAQDFEAVTLFGSYPLALQVHAATSHRTVQDLVAAARRQPGKLNFGSIGEGSVTHLAGELFKRKAGIEAVHVPYKGSSALTTAMIAGEIDFLFDSGGAAKPFIDAGRVRALAVTGKSRSPVLPDVPSLAESGIAGVDVRVWIGMFAPKGTPQDLVSMVAQAVRRLLQQDVDVRRAFADNGTEIVASTPEAFAEVLRQEKATWQTLIESLKLAKD